MFGHVTCKLIDSFAHLYVRVCVCVYTHVQMNPGWPGTVRQAGVPLTKIHLELPPKFGIKGVWTTPG